LNYTKKNFVINVKTAINILLYVKLLYKRERVERLNVIIMKESTALNQISKIVNQINYKSVYIEIETDTDKWTLDKTRKRNIGFKVEQNTIK
jgi:hypothetical protein